MMNKQLFVPNHLGYTRAAQVVASNHVTVPKTSTAFGALKNGSESNKYGNIFALIGRGACIRTDASHSSSSGTTKISDATLKPGLKRNSSRVIASIDGLGRSSRGKRNEPSKRDVAANTPNTSVNSKWLNLPSRDAQDLRNSDKSIEAIWDMIDLSGNSSDSVKSEKSDEKSEKCTQSIKIEKMVCLAEDDDDEVEMIGICKFAPKYAKNMKLTLRSDSREFRKKLKQGKEETKEKTKESNQDKNVHVKSEKKQLVGPIKVNYTNHTGAANSTNGTNGTNGTANVSKKNNNYIRVRNGPNMMKIDNSANGTIPNINIININITNFNNFNNFNNSSDNINLNNGSSSTRNNYIDSRHSNNSSSSSIEVDMNPNQARNGMDMVNGGNNRINTSEDTLILDNVKFSIYDLLNVLNANQVGKIDDDSNNNLEQKIRQCIISRLTSIPDVLLQALQQHKASNTFVVHKHGLESFSFINEVGIFLLSTKFNIEKKTIDKLILKHRLEQINFIFGNLLDSSEIDSFLLFCIKNEIETTSVLMKYFSTMRFLQPSNKEIRTNFLSVVDKAFEQQK